MNKRILFVLLAFIGFISPAMAQKVAVKTNLLYDATSTINLGTEFGLSPKWTLDVSANYNPWTYSNNKKWKHWLVQPEARYIIRKTKCFRPAKRNVQKAKRNVFVLDTLPKPYKK